MAIAWIFFFVLGALTPAFPKDKTAEAAQALIQKATEISDVGSTGSVTLRIRAKFFAVKSGTIDAQYEKISVSPQQWRATFSSPEYNSITVYADSQISEWSDAEEKPIRVRQFEGALAALSQFVVGDGPEFTLRQLKQKDTGKKIPCLDIKDRRRLVHDCFDPDTGAFLSVQKDNWTFLYAGYKHLGSKVFPETFAIVEDFRTVAVAKVEQLESSSAPEPKFFEPPDHAEVYPACPEALGLPLGPKGGKAVKKPAPRSAGLPPGSGIISNDAVVDAILGRDGRLHEIKVSDNIPLLRDATYEAVRQWEYEPFTVCGHAIEMPVDFTVWFSKSGSFIGTSEHD